MNSLKRTVTLTLSANMHFVRLVQSVVEETATAFKLSPAKTTKLTMSAEEVLTHLATITEGTEIRIEIHDYGWCISTTFSFVLDPSDLWAMNYVTKEDLLSEESEQHLGMMLTAKMSDSFSIKLEGHTVILELIQEQVYPVITPKPADSSVFKAPFSIVENPDPFLIEQACMHAISRYQSHELKPLFFTPEKVIELCKQNQLQILIAIDKVGQTAGMICWQQGSHTFIRFYGPYLFSEDKEIAELLERQFLQKIARSSAIAVFADTYTKDLIQDNYERIGTLKQYCQMNGMIERGQWLRQIKEDTESSVWCSPLLLNFLEETYDELALMRHIKEISSAKFDATRSVITTDLTPQLRTAQLTPMVGGIDIEQNIQIHTESLLQNQYEVILFNIDLGYSWQANIAESLIKSNFKPKVLLPSGGKSDVVVFQYEHV